MYQPAFLEKLYIKGSINQFLSISLGTAVTAYLHYSEAESSHFVHVMHYYLFFLLVIFSAYSFGFIGGVMSSFVLTLIYNIRFFQHMGHDPQLMLEGILMIAVGGVTGYFSQKAHLEKMKFLKVSEELEQTLNVVKKNSEEMLMLQKEVARTDRLRMLGQLTAGVAHEIRNPLAAIKSGVLMIKKDGRNEQILNIVTDEIKRLDGIVEKFLQYARIGKQTDEVVTVNGFLEEVTAMVELLHRDYQDVVFETDFRVKAESTLRGDVAALKQAFLNIILNAFESLADLGKGGVIRFSAKVDGKELLFEITDNGKGISREIQERIFEPFFTTKSNGTGLGLSIASKIIEEHGGKISVESNGGAKFIIILPANKDENTAC